MRILLLWSAPTSTNLGVRALDAGTRALAEMAFGSVDVVALNYGSDVAPMRVGSWKALAKELVTGRAGLVHWLSEFDLVIDTRGGDSFADIYGFERHLTMTILAEAVRRSGAPLVLGPQTAGPFARRVSRIAARWTLRTAVVSMARDHVSEEVMTRLGAKSRLVTDVVFALPPPAAGPIRERDVLLNVSGLLWNPNPHADHEAYRRTVVELAGKLTASGRKVALLAHVLSGPTGDDDVPAVEAAKSMLNDDVEIVIPEGLDDARRTISDCRLVIASRMHACLNAISVGVPAIPLAYSRKFAPLLADLGYPISVDLRSEPDPVSAVMAAATTAQLSTQADASRARAEALIGHAADALRGIVR